VLKTYMACYAYYDDHEEEAAEKDLVVVENMYVKSVRALEMHS
jgi:hypothetical protein